ncbi:transposase [Kribbella sp. NPDC051718]|uniref:RNA-guided endonuclease InsQ/TnpB family protein n=1 Tax=Kribbella sp. NPDC051718 TaxID=3155168 RepID=UPI003416D86E
MSVRQRLYPDPGQLVGLRKHADDARFVFNLGLEQRSFWRREKHTRGTHAEHGSLDATPITLGTQMRELVQLRAALPWLWAGSSSVQQGALRDLDQAFANFYAGRAKYPAFKRRDDRAGGFVVRDIFVRRLNRRWGTVTVPKIGRVRFRITRSWADITQATSARVTLRNGRWHIAFTTPPAERTLSGTGAAVGIDRGVRNTLATSDGRMIQAPSLTKVEQARFLRLEQRLARQSRKDGGSRRRQVTLDQLAVLRRRLADRRTDWIEQTTTHFASTYDQVAVEDLRVRNMVRRPAAKPDPAQPGVFLSNGARAKAVLNRSILASLWGRFLTRLEHKMGSARVARVNPRNTSRTCAACGHCAPGNRESQAVFECEACGHQGHADTNAAAVILGRALDSISAAGHAVPGRRSPALAGSANQSDP